MLSISMLLYLLCWYDEILRDPSVFKVSRDLRQDSTGVTIIYTSNILHHILSVCWIVLDFSSDSEEKVQDQSVSNISGYW